MSSPAITRDEIEDTLNLSDDWNTHFVKDNLGKNPELYLGERGNETAALEVTRGDIATLIDVYHVEYPELPHSNGDIPGHIGHLSFEEWEDALDALQVLADEDRLETLAELVTSTDTHTKRPLEQAFETISEDA